ncbi:copper amine oxidase N-terminal domain-containing protein [Heliophilum fasciatum]|uniref:Copper amine oxidase-like protein n=1 Tax=Heliophilum fasciatum TaxID=35700 RepID=A0A4R2RRL2_9FIRM|nr:copper amine oxidase N-terminal domain-containing protein [Heliophilum fasciatum]MCW2278943.1 hypothetical protein [Heliophilum fasciatum]TCP61805.1 copper amine oxidase-like protein [Heliophilum fasciatum]
MKRYWHGVVSAALLALVTVVAMPEVGQAATYQVVSAAPVGANELFDRRVIVEVPANALALGETDQLHLRLNADVSARRIAYQIPATVGGSTNMFVAASGDMAGGNRTFSLTVTGSGGSGEGRIVLDLIDVQAEGGVRDVRLMIESAPSSIFQPGESTLTSGVLADYAVAATWSGVNEPVTLRFRELKAGQIRTGSDSITLQLPAGYTWDARAARLERTEGNLELGALEGDGTGTLRVPVRQVSGRATDFYIANLRVRSAQFLEGATHVTMQVGGTSRVTANQLTLPVAPDREKVAQFRMGDNTYTVRGQKLTVETAPYIKDGRAYLPLRAVAELCGVAAQDVRWEPRDQSITLRQGDVTLRLVLGSREMEVIKRQADGKTATSLVVMDAAPELSKEMRTCLPIRWVVEALGREVIWDETQGQVTIVRRLF